MTARQVLSSNFRLLEYRLAIHNLHNKDYVCWSFIQKSIPTSLVVYTLEERDILIVAYTHCPQFFKVKPMVYTKLFNTVSPYFIDWKSSHITNPPR